MFNNEFKTKFRVLLEWFVSGYFLLCTIVFIGQFFKVKGVFALILMILFWFSLIPISWLDAMGFRSNLLGPLSQAYPMVSLYISNILFSIILSFICTLIWHLLSSKIIFYDSRNN